MTSVKVSFDQQGEDSSHLSSMINSIKKVQEVIHEKVESEEFGLDDQSSESSQKSSHYLTESEKAEVETPREAQ